MEYLTRFSHGGGAPAEGKHAPQHGNWSSQRHRANKTRAAAPSRTFSLQQHALAAITYLSRVLRSASAMSFETTATIASFGGKLLKLSHQSSSTNTEMKLNLYLPPQASKSGAKVPVLFYLSGLTCTGDNCSEKGFFQHGASQKGIAVVYPDTSPRMLGRFQVLISII